MAELAPQVAPLDLQEAAAFMPLVASGWNWHNLVVGACGKPLFWVGSALDDLRDFPAGVKRVVGFALRQAQDGGKNVDARPLKGFGGAGVLEIVDDDDGDTYRAVYTVRFFAAVYVLHAFKKKSTRGIRTPKREMELVEERLKRAEEHYSRWAQEVE